MECVLRVVAEVRVQPQREHKDCVDLLLVSARGISGPRRLARAIQVMGCGGSRWAEDRNSRASTITRQRQMCSRAIHGTHTPTKSDWPRYGGLLLDFLPRGSRVSSQRVCIAKEVVRFGETTSTDYDPAFCAVKRKIIEVNWRFSRSRFQSMLRCFVPKKCFLRMQNSATSTGDMGPTAKRIHCRNVRCQEKGATFGSTRIELLLAFREVLILIFFQNS